MHTDIETRKTPFTVLTPAWYDPKLMTPEVALSAIRLFEIHQVKGTWLYPVKLEHITRLNPVRFEEVREALETFGVYRSWKHNNSPNHRFIFKPISTLLVPPDKRDDRSFQTALYRSSAWWLKKLFKAGWNVHEIQSCAKKYFPYLHTKLNHLHKLRFSMLQSEVDTANPYFVQKISEVKARLQLHEEYGSDFLYTEFGWRMGIEPLDYTNTKEFPQEPDLFKAYIENLRNIGEVEGGYFSDDVYHSSRGLTIPSFRDFHVTNPFEYPLSFLPTVRYNFVTSVRRLSAIAAVKRLAQHAEKDRWGNYHIGPLSIRKQARIGREVLRQSCSRFGLTEEHLQWTSGQPDTMTRRALVQMGFIMMLEPKDRPDTEFLALGDRLLEFDVGEIFEKLISGKNSFETVRRRSPLKKLGYENDPNVNKFVPMEKKFSVQLNSSNVSTETEETQLDMTIDTQTDNNVEESKVKGLIQRLTSLRKQGAISDNLFSDVLRDYKEMFGEDLEIEPPDPKEIEDPVTSPLVCGYPTKRKGRPPCSRYRKLDENNRCWQHPISEDETNPEKAQELVEAFRSFLQDNGLDPENINVCIPSQKVRDVVQDFLGLNNLPIRGQSSFSLWSYLRNFFDTPLFERYNVRKGRPSGRNYRGLVWENDKRDSIMSWDEAVEKAQDKGSEPEESVSSEASESKPKKVQMLPNEVQIAIRAQLQVVRRFDYPYTLQDLVEDLEEQFDTEFNRGSLIGFLINEGIVSFSDIAIN